MTRIDDSLASCLLLRRGDYPYLVHGLMDGVPRVDPALLEEWTDWAAAQDILRGATVLLAPEAMALPLAAALSLRTGIPYLVARKREYGLPGETAVHYKTGYSQSRLHINDLRPGDRIVVVDDVLSTGGTLDSLLGTLTGMGAQVQGVLLFLDKGEAAAGLSARHGVTFRTMRRVRVEADRVVAVPTGDA